MISGKKTREAAIMDWSLFLSAYAPMFVIAAVKWEGAPLKIGLAACFVLAAAPMMAILLFGAGQEGGNFVINTVEVGADLNAGFLATYLLPFLTTDTPSRNSLIAYALFVWIVGLIFTRGSMGRVNPLLYILGFDIADVTTPEGPFSLVTRHLPEQGETIKATRLLSGNILLHLEK
jgi:hypothetical protein